MIALLNYYRNMYGVYNVSVLYTIGQTVKHETTNS